MKKTTLSLLFLLLCSTSVFAIDNVGRLGVGMTNQLINGIPAFSMRIQRSPTFAMGAMGGIRFGGNDNAYGAGLKFYRIIFDEPNLNFFMAGMGAIVNEEINGTSETGFQVDGTFGSEFFFRGLESIGFSFEFGLSVNKLGNDTIFETTASNFIVAGVHFYL